MDETFAGKIALVTGSSKGIGLATALRLARAGADIVIHNRRDAAAAESAVAAVEATGRRALACAADLADPEAIRTMFGQIRETYGGLDILVANAAATAFRPVLDQKPHNISRTFDVIVRGLVVCAQEAVPLMAGRGGKVVTVSGLDTLQFIPRHGILAAAKSAQESLVRYLACELAPLGITVNGVNPGMFDTESAHIYVEQGLGMDFATWSETMVGHTPLQRLGQPEDVAEVIAFLCSPAAAFICGQVIVVDGGLSLLGIASLV